MGRVFASTCWLSFVLEGRSHQRRIPFAFPPCPVHGWEFHVVGWMHRRVWMRPFRRGLYLASLLSFRCLCLGFVSRADPTKVGTCSTSHSILQARRPRTRLAQQPQQPNERRLIPIDSSGWTDRDEVSEIDREMDRLRLTEMD